MKITLRVNDTTFTYVRPWLPQYQKDIIDSDARYTICEATTKSGKTVSHIIWILEEALKGQEGNNFWWVAPVYSQSKIAFTRIQRFIKTKDLFTSNKSELSITLANGAVIWFKSAEKPDNLYGEDVYGCVIDEMTRIGEDSWFAIRSTITATGGKVKMIGNVKGKDNWAHQLGVKAQEGKLKSSEYFKITAVDAVEAGVMAQEEFDSAKEILPPPIFDELYMGIPRSPVDNPWIFSFDYASHVDSWSDLDPYSTPDPRKPLVISFDFNVDPMTATVHQSGINWARTYREYSISNNTIEEVCKRIKTHFPGYLYLVTGDSTGKQRRPMVAGFKGYYHIIKNELGIGSGQIKLKTNPPHSESRVMCNQFLHRFPDYRIHPDCRELIADFMYVESNESDQIEKGKDKRRTHVLDGWRYWVYNFHMDWYKRELRGLQRAG